MVRKILTIDAKLHGLMDHLKELEKMKLIDDLKTLAVDEINLVHDDIRHYEFDLRQSLSPPSDKKSSIVEIRAGVGGEEASLFAATLRRMYERLCLRKKWPFESISQSPHGANGLKECVVEVGAESFHQLQYESGVHRVQRVSPTDASGRVHTSTVSVAVLPLPTNINDDLDPKELKIETKRSSGAGGQHVNKTESAIRVTHLPTGLVVSMQDDRSQHRNKSKALKVLAARVFELKRSKTDGERIDQRRKLIGTASRSEKIRTYNYPHGRVTDHRTGNHTSLSAVLDGEEELEELILDCNLHFYLDSIK